MKLKGLGEHDKMLVLVSVLLDPENAVASLATGDDLESEVLLACEELVQLPLELRVPYVASMLRNVSHLS